MTTPLLAISRFRLKNFKAVRDSGTVKFTPLTVFIGNNGVGKSSLIEGLEMVKAISEDGLDKAMQQWRDFEYIWNQAVPHTLRTSPGGRQYQTNPMSFDLRGAALRGDKEKNNWGTFHALSEVTAGPGANEIFFLREEVVLDESGQPRRTVRHSLDDGLSEKVLGRQDRLISSAFPPEASVLPAELSIRGWQFVRLNPEAMRMEKPLLRGLRYLPLATDGSNIGEYLLNLRQRDPGIIDGIVETLQTVLPYAVDIQPTITTEIGRSIYLQLSEGKFKIPSWLFSTGTLRVVALLALLRNPEPPPLIVIEELENGLDPRTVNLIVDEIREVVSTGKSQVIITTHSPYLLDLVPLSSLIFVERIDGQPTFIRPEDDDSVQRWSQDFAPGKLYTMGKFRQSR